MEKNILTKELIHWVKITVCYTGTKLCKICWVSLKQFVSSTKVLTNVLEGGNRTNVTAAKNGLKIFLLDRELRLRFIRDERRLRRNLEKRTLGANNEKVINEIFGRKSLSFSWKLFLPKYRNKYLVSLNIFPFSFLSNETNLCLAILGLKIVLQSVTSLYWTELRANQKGRYVAENIYNKCNSYKPLWLSQVTSRLASPVRVDETPPMRDRMLLWLSRSSVNWKLG